MQRSKAQRLQQELQEAQRETANDKQFLESLEEPQAHEIERLNREIQEKQDAIELMEEEIKRRQEEKTIDFSDRTTIKIMDYLRTRKVQDLLSELSKKRKRGTQQSKVTKGKRLKASKDDEEERGLAGQMYQALTGITFTKKHDTLTSNSDGVMIRRCDLRGQACGLAFMVLYEAKEQEKHEVITRLKIKVPNAIEADLQPLVSMVQKERALKTFFIKFVEYAELHERRKKLFALLQQRYQGSISLPHGASSSCLYFKPVPDTSFQLQLLWEIQFKENLALVHGVDLLPFTPTISAEIKEVVQRLPLRFKDLVKQKGLEEAIDIIFKKCLPD